MSEKMEKIPTHNRGIVPKKDKAVRPAALKTVDNKPVAIGHRRKSSKQQ